MRCVLLVMLLAACGDNRDTKGIANCTVGGEPLNVFVFNRENMWMHPSQPAAVQMWKDIAVRKNWHLEVSDDGAALTDRDTLQHADVIVFSITSGEVLEPDQRATLEPYFAGGLGLVATHSASASEGGWPFYREMLPVTFKTHPVNPSIHAADMTMLDTEHPILAGLPNPWRVTDEYYTFNEKVEDIDGVNPLYALDENTNTTYPEINKIGFHPIAFTTERAGNRVFYTSLGHPPEQYAVPEFVGMLERAVEWAGAERHKFRCEN